MTKARELMTKDVLAVSPDTPAREIARLLLDRSVSAAPVVDASGAVIGMVSEGDLIGRAEMDREARRDWWLALLAEGGTLNPDFLASLRNGAQTARDVMSAPVITVDEAAEAAEIARLLASYRIKRVPVLRDGKLVGIVSRADLLRGLAAGHPPGSGAEQPQASQGMLSGAIAHLDQRFFGGPRPAAGSHSEVAPATAVRANGAGVSRADFQALVSDSERQKAARRDALRQEGVLKRRAQVKDMTDHHINDPSWQALLQRARQAAEAGEKEALLLRFPSALCSDGGRAINAPEPDWPATLRGEAAEVYLRWEQELKPAGFQLVARVLDFPGGVPGDIGLILVWGE